MSLKKKFGKNVTAGLVAAGAALCMGVFSACSNGGEAPSGVDSDVSAVDAADAPAEARLRHRNRARRSSLGRLMKTPLWENPSLRLPVPVKVLAQANRKSLL